MRLTPRICLRRRSLSRPPPRHLPAHPRASRAGRVAGWSIGDVIAPPLGELFSETNDNSVALLLSYGTARILLASDAEVREEEEYRRAAPTRGPKRSSTFRNYTHFEPRFRALRAEGASEVEVVLV